MHRSDEKEMRLTLAHSGTCDNLIEIQTVFLQLNLVVGLGDSCGALLCLREFIRSSIADRCDLSRPASSSPGGAGLVRLPPSR